MHRRPAVCGRREERTQPVRWFSGNRVVACVPSTASGENIYNALSIHPKFLLLEENPGLKSETWATHSMLGPGLKSTAATKETPGAPLGRLTTEPAFP